MTAIRPERISDIDQADAAQFEGEIREFVRRDVSIRRRYRAEHDSEASVDSVKTLIERVSGASVAEIDHVITELQSMRDTLRNEGERMRHELSDYAGLSQSAMLSMKIIGDGLAQWRPSTLRVERSTG